MKKLLLLTMAAVVLAACGNKIPDVFTESDDLPNIYPDYTNVTVPINIAPLTFQSDRQVDDMVARLTAGDVEIIYGGCKVQPDMSEWHKLIQAAIKQQPAAITVEVYIEKYNHWTRFKPFNT